MRGGIVEDQVYAPTYRRKGACECGEQARRIRKQLTASGLEVVREPRRCPAGERFFRSGPPTDRRPERELRKRGVEMKCLRPKCGQMHDLETGSTFQCPGCQQEFRIADQKKAGRLCPKCEEPIG